MTLGEARSVIACWADEPPMVSFVEAIARGLGGFTDKTPNVAANDVKPITDEQVGNLAREAGPMIAMQPKDSGLPGKAPVFDLETLKQRNAAIADKAELIVKRSHPLV